MEYNKNSRGDCFFCWAWNLESVLDTLIDYGCDITSVTPVTYIWLPFFSFALRYSITYVQPLNNTEFEEAKTAESKQENSEENETSK